MDILYIGMPCAVIKSGADQVNKRNIEILRKNCDSLKILSPFSDRGIKRYLFGIEKKFIEEVIGELKQHEYEVVFISQSLMGRIARIIKNKFPAIKIICFFHNIERHYATELLRVSGLLHCPFYFAARYFEKIATDYSDFLIVLNQRDAALLWKVYHRKADLLMPISVEDNYTKKQLCPVTGDIMYLFVGKAFFANIEAVEWFIREVLPSVPGQFIVIGDGMDKHIKKIASSRVKVYGYIEDLSYFYSMATYVVSPVFSGGGMKTKISEALMYGKAILGTKEAFEGYERCEVMYECNNALTFINTINELINSHNCALFHESARAFYLKNYSFQAVCSIFSKWFIPIVEAKDKYIVDNNSIRK